MNNAEHYESDFGSRVLKIMIETALDCHKNL